MEQAPAELPGQECPMCKTKNLTLIELSKEIPYFGQVYIFSMSCSNCNYHKADVEPAETHEPMKQEILIDNEEALKIRVVKSSTATIKIPRIMSIESGPGSNGYVTNIEGILNRVKTMLEKARDDAEDNEDRKKVKNMLKKIMDVMWGRGSIKLIIEDPSGNSAIISEKATKSKL